MNDLALAKGTLENGDFTLVLTRGDVTKTSSLRGVRSLLSLVESGEDYSGFSAADLIIGKAAALLYVKLGVRAVFGRVMSKAGLSVLHQNNVNASYETLTDGIVNRRGDGVCPMEQVVASISDPDCAFYVLRERVNYLQAHGMPQRPASRADEIEAALRKRRRFKDKLFNRFAKAVVTYELISPHDRIAVCISGGKDSMLMAKLFQELQRHRKIPFDLMFLVMDPGYTPENRRAIEDNAAVLGIPLTIFETRIFDAVDNVEKNPCYLCARMRRGHLYKTAQALGCNKIALGHHFNDVIETSLMGMLWGGQVQTMPPKLHSTNYPGMELIRPMYMIREEDILAWRDFHKLKFLQCACHFTENCSAVRENGKSISKRMETKQLIQQLKKTNPNVDVNIFNSMHNVCLDTVLGYTTHGEEHSFLERFERAKME